MATQRKLDRLREFKEKQNCPFVECGPTDKVEIGPNQYKPGLLFENGAFTDLTTYMDPPADEVPLAIMQIQYYERALERKTDQFRKAKEVAAHQAQFNGNSAPTITQYHIDGVKALQKEVKKLKKQVKACQKIIDNEPNRKRKAEVEQLAELARFESEAERIRLLRELNSIEI